MKGIIDKKLQNVISLPAEERYNYFLRKVADFEEVWGLYDNGWALSGGKEMRIVPFWPEKEFADACANNEWARYKPQAIPLTDFMEKWLVGMEKDGSLLQYSIPPKTGE